MPLLPCVVFNLVLQLSRFGLMRPLLAMGGHMLVPLKRRDEEPFEEMVAFRLLLN